MSHPTLSPDTEVILLLCGRFGGEREEAFHPLSVRDYGELAKWLNLRGLRPSDLMQATGLGQLQDVHEAKLERRRIEFLLGRGAGLALALERWNRGGLWVISRGDAEFPKRLKRHLKHQAPPLLYGAGNKDLLDRGGMAIIGSRDATESALQFTREIAAQCAHEGLGVISGGARGVDAAAMQGAAEAGGCVLGVLACDLLKASLNRQNRLGLQEGRLALVSPYFPEAAFNAGNAMGRNKYIYALSDRALVIDSALGSGGTWEGAVEALKQMWVPVYVRSPGQGPGNGALIEKGGIPFSHVPSYGEHFSALFTDESPTQHKVAEAEPLQPSLLQSPGNDPADVRSTVLSCECCESKDTTALQDASVSAPSSTPSGQDAKEQLESGATASAEMAFDMYEDFLAKLTRALSRDPLTEEQIADRLGLERAQTKAWLKRALEARRVEKLHKPVRYSLGLQSSLLS